MSSIFKDYFSFFVKKQNKKTWVMVIKKAYRTGKCISVHRVIS